MGAENVARELIREAVGEAFSIYLGSVDLRPVVAHFEGGGSLSSATRPPPTRLVSQLRACRRGCSTRALLGAPVGRAAPSWPPRAEFILEGLHAQKKIGRSDERGFFALERRDTGVDLEKLERLRRMKKQVN